MRSAFLQRRRHARSSVGVVSSSGVVLIGPSVLLMKAYSGWLEERSNSRPWSAKRRPCTPTWHVGRGCGMWLSHLGACVDVSPRLALPCSMVCDRAASPLRAQACRISPSWQKRRRIHMLRLSIQLTRHERPTAPRCRSEA